MTLIIGKQIENQVCKYLIAQNLYLITQNFRWKGGEIDIIMQDSADNLIFIEVRYRKNAEYGSAMETVSISKQRKIYHTAQVFLQQHPEFHDYNLRFDIVAVDVIMGKAKLTWLQNAFYGYS